MAIPFPSARLTDLSSSTLLTQQSREDCQAALEDIHTLSSILHAYLEHYTDLVMRLEDRFHEVCIPIPLVHTGRAGRPLFLISKSQIEVLSDLGYSYARMARIFGISERTLLRRREEFGLPIGQTYTNIGDDELDVTVRAIYQVFLISLLLQKK